MKIKTNDDVVFEIGVIRRDKKIEIDRGGFDLSDYNFKPTDEQSIKFIVEGISYSEFEFAISFNGFDGFTKLVCLVAKNVYEFNKKESDNLDIGVIGDCLCPVSINLLCAIKIARQRYGVRARTSPKLTEWAVKICNQIKDLSHSGLTDDYLFDFDEMKKCDLDETEIKTYLNKFETILRKSGCGKSTIQSRVKLFEKNLHKIFPDQYYNGDGIIVNIDSIGAVQTYIEDAYRGNLLDGPRGGSDALIKRTLEKLGIPSHQINLFISPLGERMYMAANFEGVGEAMKRKVLENKDILHSKFGIVVDADRLIAPLTVMYKIPGNYSIVIDKPHYVEMGKEIFYIRLTVDTKTNMDFWESTYNYFKSNVYEFSDNAAEKSGSLMDQVLRKLDWELKNEK